MATKKIINEFLSKFTFICELIEIVNANSKQQLANLEIPNDIALSIKQKAANCSILWKKYNFTLTKNILDSDYLDKVEEVYENYYFDLNFVLEFDAMLDLSLMAYGEGPQFQHRKYLHQSFYKA